MQSGDGGVPVPWPEGQANFNACRAQLIASQLATARPGFLRNCPHSPPARSAGITIVRRACVIIFRYPRLHPTPLVMECTMPSYFDTPLVWGPVRVGALSGLGPCPGRGPYGPMWALMGPYGPLWTHMGPARALEEREKFKNNAHFLK